MKKFADFTWRIHPENTTLYVNKVKIISIQVDSPESQFTQINISQFKLILNNN